MAASFKDLEGTKIKVGDRVARAYRSDTRAHLEIRAVARIEGDKLYLNDSHQPIEHTDNLLVL